MLSVDPMPDASANAASKGLMPSIGALDWIEGQGSSTGKWRGLRPAARNGGVRVPMLKASFKSLEAATTADWDLIADPDNSRREAEKLVQNLFHLLEMQRDDDTFGWPVNGYEHCLQTATRALRDQADDETIVCALFHDATEAIDFGDHAASAAQLLSPFVSSENVWMVRNHAAFQNFHCKNNPARFTLAREAFADHPAYGRTVRFCALWDQTSFDPGYDTMALHQFEPIVRRVLLKDRA